jgi:hypothetical protein
MGFTSRIWAWMRTWRRWWTKRNATLDVPGVQRVVLMVDGTVDRKMEEDVAYNVGWYAYS